MTDDGAPQSFAEQQVTITMLAAGFVDSELLVVGTSGNGTISADVSHPAHVTITINRPSSR